MSIKYNEQGLVPVVVQDELTGQVRMMAYMNQEALEHTVATGDATFYSRSRKKLWIKGETSGNTLRVGSMFLDCDNDTVLLLVTPLGPTCHTGSPSCFFRHWQQDSFVEQPVDAAPFMQRLEQELFSRTQTSGKQSYTKRLLDQGVEAIVAKIIEESQELSQALRNESDERVISETADVLYHVMVGLLSRSVSWRQVMAELSRRFGVSGLVEKTQRKQDVST
jgi:phosphoribosyl-AMP cyclohydrolase / phosphoribosyl-ATP pyrophosphohydrolase